MLAKCREFLLWKTDEHARIIEKQRALAGFDDRNQRMLSMRDMKESKIMWRVYHSLLWNLSLWSDDYHHLLQCFGNGACGNRFCQLKRKTGQTEKRKREKDPTFIDKNKEVEVNSKGIVKDRLLFEILKWRNDKRHNVPSSLSIERSFIFLPGKIIASSAYRLLSGSTWAFFSTR